MCPRGQGRPRGLHLCNVAFSHVHFLSPFLGSGARSWLKYRVCKKILTSKETRKLQSLYQINYKIKLIVAFFWWGHSKDFLLVDWKLRVFFFFSSSRFIFLEYADSSNQRDFRRNFFLFGSLALRIRPIKSSEYAWPQKKNSQQKPTFFLQCSSLFLRKSVSSLLNR